MQSMPKLRLAARGKSRLVILPARSVLLSDHSAREILNGSLGAASASFIENGKTDNPKTVPVLTLRKALRRIGLWEQLLQDLCPSKRAGKCRIALIKARNASVTANASRKGSATSQTIGKSRSARIATGQHKSSRMHQHRKVRKVVMVIFLYGLTQAMSTTQEFKRRSFAVLRIAGLRFPLGT